MPTIARTRLSEIPLWDGASKGPRVGSWPPPMGYLQLQAVLEYMTAEVAPLNGPSLG